MFIKDKSINFLFYTVYIVFWTAIGATPSQLINLNNNKEIANFFLIYVPLFISIFILIPLGLKNIINNIKITNIFKFHYLFFFLFFFQLIGLIFNTDLNFNLTNSYLAILGLGFTSIVILAEAREIKIFTYFIYLSMLVLFILSLIILHSKIDILLFTSDKYLYSYIIPGEQFVNQSMPRTSGLSRTLAILVIFFICLLTWKLKNNFFIIFLLILSLIFGFFIYGLQSRGSILCYISVFLVLIFFTKKLNFNFKIFFLLWFLFMPAIMYETFLYFKKNKPELVLNLREFIKDDNKVLTNNFTDERLKLINEDSTGNRVFDSKQTTTGRTFLWKEVIKNYDFKKIFGYGPQADRFLIKSDQGRWLGNNSSNAMIYSFASGGYFCLLIMLMIYCRGVYLLFIFIFIKKIFSNSSYTELKISYLFFLFFLIRSIFENSFALFSTDFILTITSITIIESYYNKKNLIKLS